jgi:hypothetical protein
MKERQAFSVAYFTNYVHVFVPDYGQIEWPKHVVER